MRHLCHINRYKIDISLFSSTILGAILPQNNDSTSQYPYFWRLTDAAVSDTFAAE